MSRRPFFLPVLLCALAGLAASAHARSWGFDRDTVYEWGDVSTGRAKLVNDGPAALVLDSAFTETLLKPWGELSFALDAGSTFEKIFRPAFPASALDPVITSGGHASLRTFDVIPSTCTLKIAADSTVDTVSVRLRVRSTEGEEDTLVVTGTSCARLSVGLRPLAPGVPAASAPAAGDRDALGRETFPAKDFRAILRRP
jgi:hypothetical protein